MKKCVENKLSSSAKNCINSALMDDNGGHFAVTPPVALHDCLTFLCSLVTIWQAEA